MKAMYEPQATSSVIFAVVGNPWALLGMWLLCINLFAFAQMGLDKRRSRRENARRIPEKRLFLSALLGGSLGAIAGMRVFHHKTKHWYFVWGMPVILALQLALAAWLVFFR